MSRLLLLWLLNRLREPSTWVSISVLFSLFGVHIDDELWQAIVSFGAAVAALLGVLLREKSEPPPIQLVGRATDYISPTDRMHGVTLGLPPTHDATPTHSTPDYGKRDGWNG